MKRAVAVAILLILLFSSPLAAFAQPSPTPTGADAPAERPREPTERFVYLAVALLFGLLAIIGISYLRTVVRSTGTR